MNTDKESNELFLMPQLIHHIDQIVTHVTL